LTITAGRWTQNAVFSWTAKSGTSQRTGTEKVTVTYPVISLDDIETVVKDQIGQKIIDWLVTLFTKPDWLPSPGEVEKTFTDIWKDTSKVFESVGNTIANGVSSIPVIGSWIKSLVKEEPPPPPSPQPQPPKNPLEYVVWARAN
jgi:hypothetical protein